MVQNSLKKLIAKAETQLQAQAPQAALDILAKAPADPYVLYLKGVAYLSLTQLEDAASCLMQAEKRDKKTAPLPAHFWDALAQAKFMTRDYDGAARAFETLRSRGEMSGTALLMSGVSHRELGNSARAHADLELALQHGASAELVHLHKGIALTHAQRFEEAIKSYEKVLLLNAENIEARINLGKCLNDLCRSLKALDVVKPLFGKLQALSHDNLFILSDILCKTGHWHEGFKLYEHRRALPTVYRADHSTAPLWDGMATDGTILVYGEQGFGDSLQFIRFVWAVLTRCPHVILYIQPELVSLCQQVFQELAVTVIAWEQDIPAEHSFKIALMSLATVFDATPQTVPYAEGYIHLSASEPQDVPDGAQDLQGMQGTPVRKPRVGLAWQGRKVHPNDHFRSLNAAQISAVLAHDEVTWVNCQVKAEEESVPPELWSILEHPDQQPTDFLEFAHVLQGLDGLVTIDSAPVHLAGAMGLPTLLILPMNGEWRWMTPEHASWQHQTPWYSSVRIYRQPQLGDDALTGFAAQFQTFLEQALTKT